ncbi:hypothetical protein C8R43DRAFT_877524, partial [Mycena crocata]
MGDGSLLIDRLPPAPPPSALDNLVVEALEAARTTKEENDVYYGPVSAASRPVSVYVATSCIKAGKPGAQAGCGLYWGDRSPANVASAVPGNQSDARAALYAVALAIITSPGHKTLTIYSVSQYAIRSFCYWAGGNATRGWPCKHADIIRVGAEHLRARTAAVTFCWVNSEQAQKNKHLKEAQALAKRAA